MIRTHPPKAYPQINNGEPKPPDFLTARTDSDILSDFRQRPCYGPPRGHRRRLPVPTATLRPNGGRHDSTASSRR
ncbi:hypothetical protein FRACA_530029 [Frankia canadensis]|uniref:Uncharacterized protein n=1 Tax=Frankia canadensis TaxID=1836972 RepID=A0A2I2KYS6_9ACTN|nr:hypothetical protein FRACA_530029 [Frankia canadensis]SOU58096.1 hypothetical protein FRACA_530029 [Frankia canadensis]